MKSSHCKTRWHDRCVREIHNVDDSIDICECDCHGLGADPPVEAVYNRQVLGTPLLEDAPPPHPLPFDHGKYRIAEEPIGTDPNLPWQDTRCTECREQTWAKNVASVEKEEAICESCAYFLLDEHYTELAKRQRGWNNNQPPPIAL